MVDETALNVLIAEGIDVPTAVAGSIRERANQRIDKRRDPYVRVGFALGFIGAVVYWIVHCF